MTNNDTVKKSKIYKFFDFSSQRLKKKQIKEKN